MEMLSDNEVYWMPEGVRAYLRGAGYSTRALEDMEPHIREWDSWMRAVGEFYDYRDTDGFGRVHQVHRRTIMPAMRVWREWGPFSSTRRRPSPVALRSARTGSTRSSRP